MELAGGVRGSRCVEVTSPSIVGKLTRSPGQPYGASLVADFHWRACGQQPGQIAIGVGKIGLCDSAW